MGKCHEFGCQIEDGCAHPMEAGHDACSCLECGVVCRGQFPGCPDVWARGPRQIDVAAPETASAPATAPASGTLEVRMEAGNGSPPPRRISLARSRAVAAQAPEPNGADHRVSEEFEWLREAFHALHEELQDLVDDLTHQQALLAEVIEGRQADLRMALVAESLPDMVRETMNDSFRAQQEALAQPVVEAARELRVATENTSRQAEGNARQAEARIEAATSELRAAAEESTRRTEERYEALRQDLEALAVSLLSPARPRPRKAAAHPPRAASYSSQRKRPSRSSLGS